MAQQNEGDSICIEDFCGSDSEGFPVQFWADWSNKSGFVYFGGDWSIVPDLKSDNKPSAEVVNFWANYHLSMV